MPRVLFSGVVLPERATISVNTVGAEIVDAEGRPFARVSLNIWLNQITASVESDEPNLWTLRNLVKREAELLTDLAGFVTGCSFDSEITKAFTVDLASTQVFGINIPALSERAAGRDINALVASIFPLCFGTEAIYLRRCLTDLSFAIKRLDDTGFYCFRALESLRQSFGADLKEAEQWKAMAEAVGSGKDEMEPLRKHAFPARHGLPLPLSDEERKQLFLYTWGVVERYIDYRLASMGAPPAFKPQAPT